MSTKLHIRPGTESQKTHCGRIMNRPVPTDPALTLCAVCQRSAEKFHHGKITAEYQDGKWMIMVQQAPPYTVEFTSAKVVNLDTGEEASYDAEQLRELFTAKEE